MTASQLINFSVMAFTFIKWKRACDAQGFDRKLLPHTSFWQPFSAYYALTGCFTMTFVGGYTVFLKGIILLSLQPRHSFRSNNGSGTCWLMKNRCMGCTNLPLLLPHGRRLPSDFRWLEVSQENQVVRTS